MLITKKDLPTPEPIKDDADNFTAVITSSEVSTFLSPIGAGVEAQICNLHKDHTIFGPTRGKWGTAEVLEEILKQIGPAECYLTSYSVKEMPIRKILGIIDKGLITKVGCLFDERIRVHSPQAYQLLESNIVEISLTKIHAKLAVLINDDWGVLISTSANLTRNPRIEFYVVDSHRHNALTQRDWIIEKIRDGDPFTA